MDGWVTGPGSGSQRLPGAGLPPPLLSPRKVCAALALPPPLPSSQIGFGLGGLGVGVGHMLTLAQTHLHTHTFTCTPWLPQTLTPHALTCSHTHTHIHAAPSRTASPHLPASPLHPRRLTQSQELRVTVTLKNPAEPPTWGFHLEPRGAGAPWLQGTFWPPLAPHSSPGQDRHGQRPLWRAGRLSGRCPAEQPQIQGLEGAPSSGQP